MSVRDLTITEAASVSFPGLIYLAVNSGDSKLLLFPHYLHVHHAACGAVNEDEIKMPYINLIAFKSDLIFYELG